MSKVLANSQLMKQLVNGFGSPLNVLLPQQLQVNVHAVTACLGNYEINWQIYMAHKPNRSSAIVRQAARLGIGLDVASLGELRSGLSNGFPGNQMEATGPKNKQFLVLALQHGLVINVDSADELNQIAKLHQELGLAEPARVSLRIDGIFHQGRRLSESDTQFGIDIAEVPALLEWISTNPVTYDFEGFAVHFSFSASGQRAKAIEQMIDLHVEALKLGIPARSFNLGGGFKVSMLERQQDWQDFLSDLKRSLLGDGAAVSWNNNGFGIEVGEGRIKGTSAIADPFQSEGIVAELDDLLRHRLGAQGGQKVHELLRDNGISLVLEPGRALYDQCGFTLARVNFIKRSINGEWLVGLDMNRSNVNANDRELFIDPVVISEGCDTERKETAVGVYFTGNLCIPSDVITRHKVFLDQLPAAGDVVVLPNTGAYLMDFNQSETLMQRIASKVALHVEGDRIDWYCDDEYVPQSLVGEAS